MCYQSATPYLPIAAIVMFDDYTGRSICSNIEQCVLICPITIMSDTLGDVNERQQIIGSQPDPKYTFCPFHRFYHSNCTRRNICYIHGLSPVKNASNSEKKYFNYTLQCLAVCFSQQKQSEITTFVKTKCAGKILNFTTSTRDDSTLNHQRKVIPNEQTTLRI